MVQSNQRRAKLDWSNPETGAQLNTKLRRRQPHTAALVFKYRGRDLVRRGEARSAHGDSSDCENSRVVLC
jgi:hypothetical protein